MDSARAACTAGAPVNTSLRYSHSAAPDRSPNQSLVVHAASSSITVVAPQRIGCATMSSTSSS